MPSGESAALLEVGGAYRDKLSEMMDDGQSTSSGDSGHASSIEHFPTHTSSSAPICSSTTWIQSTDPHPQCSSSSSTTSSIPSSPSSEPPSPPPWDELDAPPTLSKGEIFASKHSLFSTASAVPCRICHISSFSPSNPLVSPCRCAGSLLHVHRACLVHWLELSTRKMVPAPRCELCGYFYRRGALCGLRRLHFPRVSMRDRLLNSLFLLSSIIMVICASLTVHFLRLSEQYHATIRGYRVVSSSLTNDDVTVVVCSLLFFAAFFTAVFTQYRAEASVFRIIFRFWVINSNWTIRNYDLRRDPEMLALRQARARNDVIRVEPQGIPPKSRAADGKMEFAGRHLPIAVLGPQAI